MNFMNDELRDYMHFWGYATHPDPQKGSNTQFANYSDQTPQELLKYDSFRK